MRPGTDIPADIRDICDAWYAGKDSAMFAVVHSRPFNPRELLAEVEKSIRELSATEGGPQISRLKVLRTWAELQIDLDAAELALGRAVKKAIEAGLLPGEVEAIVARIARQSQSRARKRGELPATNKA
ncbi:DNA-binding response OmpR family regulator [Pseudochelatococcus lubricantis]|uniref:DNA-binding response OmpR family regulator n=1 Tax=Pseudochelatococcus lubricantis TaxID=1538102 RepID=A0ABX0V589_9HYPH|nr:hypothetical protein [Pseudochelatococcus lubricantis]NIJ60277.1 DNA-binding response OmpR family regulator [Pseudochelatococcus lubricantis]